MAAWQYWGLDFVAGDGVDGGCMSLEMATSAGGVDVTPVTSAAVFDRDSATGLVFSARTAAIANLGTPMPITEMRLRMPPAAGFSTPRGPAFVIVRFGPTSAAAMASRVYDLRGAAPGTIVALAVSDSIDVSAISSHEVHAVMAPTPRAPAIVGPHDGSSEHAPQWDGERLIDDVVVVDGTPDVPVSRQVWLHDARTGVPVRSTWSGADGRYRFERLSASVPWRLVAVDHTRTYDPVVRDAP